VRVGAQYFSNVDLQLLQSSPGLEVLLLGLLQLAVKLDNSPQPFLHLGALLSTLLVVGMLEDAVRDEFAPILLAIGFRAGAVPTGTLRKTHERLPIDARAGAQLAEVAFQLFAHFVLGRLDLRHARFERGGRVIGGGAVGRAGRGVVRGRGARRLFPATRRSPRVFRRLAKDRRQKRVLVAQRRRRHGCDDGAL
jgi:hypothetical protein